MRIVSIVPSLTELVIDLGLGGDLVGRTKFCIHPNDRVKSIPKIGGTKNVNISAVLELKPDLILANKEENTKADVEALQSEANVHVTEISNYSEALHSIQEIGRLTNRDEAALKLIYNIKSKFSLLSNLSKSTKSVCYLIWKDPLMTIGNDTYIHDMLLKCGFVNVYGSQTRYPTIDSEALKSKNPDCIFLSSEPFPFKEKHIEEIGKMCPDAKIALVDGEYFSWYGSRMVLAAEYFQRLIKSI